MQFKCFPPTIVKNVKTNDCKKTKYVLQNSYNELQFIRIQEIQNKINKTHERLLRIVEDDHRKEERISSIDKLYVSRKMEAGIFKMKMELPLSIMDEVFGFC